MIAQQEIDLQIAIDDATDILNSVISDSNDSKQKRRCKLLAHYLDIIKNLSSKTPPCGIPIFARYCGKLTTPLNAGRAPATIMTLTTLFPTTLLTSTLSSASPENSIPTSPPPYNASLSITSSF